MKNNIVVHTGDAGKELFEKHLKELLCPPGKNCYNDSVYVTNPKVVSEKEMINSIKDSFYTNRRDKVTLKKYFKNIDHSEENRTYVDNMLKTILDKDLFKILLEDYLIKKNIIKGAYKKIDTIRRGSGLMKFLDDDSLYPYTTRGLSINYISKIWHSFPSI